MKVDISKTEYKNPFDKVIENQNKQYEELKQAYKSLTVMMNEVINTQKVSSVNNYSQPKVKKDICYWTFENNDYLMFAERDVERYYCMKGMLRRSSAKLGLKLKPIGFKSIWGLTIILLNESNKEHSKLLKNSSNIRQINFKNAHTFEELCFLFYTGKTSMEQRKTAEWSC